MAHRSLAGGTAGLFVVLAVLAVVPLFSGKQWSQAALLGVGGAALVCWLGVALFLWLVYRCEPTSRQLAMRVDTLLGLPDDLLVLGEWPEEAARWHPLAVQQAEERLQGVDLVKAWPLPFPRPARRMAGMAFCLSLAVLGLGMQAWLREGERVAQQEAAAEKRLELAKEMLEDWEAFTELTEDPELKELFAVAGELRETLKQPDAMEAMLEINRLEERLQSVAAQVAEASIASEAAEMAEALEAFEGMGAMSAALRQRDFAKAAAEAEKQAAALAEKPEATSSIRRNAAVAEMLAQQSKRAGEKGNSSLSEALRELSQQASQGERAFNQALQQPTRQMCRQFSQEQARQQRGQMLAMGKSQLDALRNRLQGQKPEENAFCSLCESSGQQPGGQQPGGKQAGTGAGSDPLGEATQLQAAGVDEQTRLAIGEGESEKVTLSDTSGSAVASAEGGATSISDYIELSRKAVNDETLPLAHRRIIRTYFERIRPMTENPQP